MRTMRNDILLIFWEPHLPSRPNTEQDMETEPLKAQEGWCLAMTALTQKKGKGPQHSSFLCKLLHCLDCTGNVRTLDQQPHQCLNSPDPCTGMEASG